MGWTYNDRQVYGAALRRAAAEIGRAHTVSEHAGDEGAGEDLVQINREILRLVEEDIRAQASANPRKTRKAGGGKAAVK